MDVHRLEIIITDLANWGFIWGTIFSMLLLYLASIFTGNPEPRLLIPFLGPVTFGFLIRLDTLVKRKGAWLASQGDLWEKWLAGHPQARFLLLYADLLIALPALAFVVWHIIYGCKHFTGHPMYQWLYGGTAVIMLLLGFYGFYLFAVKSAKGF